MVTSSHSPSIDEAPPGRRLPNEQEFLRGVEGPCDPLRVYSGQSVKVDPARKSLPTVVQPIPSHGVIARAPDIGNQRSHPYSDYIEDRNLDETSRRNPVTDCRRRIEWIRKVLFQREGAGKVIAGLFVDTHEIGRAHV